MGLGSKGILRDGAHEGLSPSGGSRVCYIVLDRTEAKASDIVTTGIVLMCHYFTSVLFDPGSSYSHVSAYFSMDLGIMYEPLD